MIDKTPADNISANIRRADQCEIDGDRMAAIRYRLFAAKDIADILRAYYINRPDQTTAKEYAKLLFITSNQILGLINHGP